MAVQLGSGEYTFEVNENWAKVPDGNHPGRLSPRSASTGKIGSMPSIAASTRSRSSMREGNLLRTWGEGVFHRPHGVHMGAGRHDLADR